MIVACSRFSSPVKLKSSWGQVLFLCFEVRHTRMKLRWHYSQFVQGFPEEIPSPRQTRTVGHPIWNLIFTIYWMHNLEVKSFNPSVSFKNCSLNAHHVSGTVSESSCFSDHSGFSSLTSRNSAKAAPGLPCAWPPLCTPSLRDDVRGSLAAWRIGLGKSPGVFRHCFWPEKQKHPRNSQGSQSAQGTYCPLLFAGPFLGQAAALCAGLLAPCSHCEARHISHKRASEMR